MMGADEDKMVDWLDVVCELREQVRVFGVGRRGRVSEHAGALPEAQ